MGLVGAAGSRGRQRRAGAAEDVQPESRDRHLREPPNDRDPSEDRGQLPRQRVGLDFRRELQVHALFVGDEPEAEELAFFGGALVDGAVERFFEAGTSTSGDADLRCVGAVRGFGGLEADLCGAAALKAVTGRGVDRHPSRQTDDRALHGRGRLPWGFRPAGCELGVEARRRRGFRVGRDRGEARVEVEFAAAGDLRKGRAWCRRFVWQLVAAGGDRDLPREAAVGRIAHERRFGQGCWAAAGGRFAC